MLGSPTIQQLRSPLKVVPSVVVLGTPPNSISNIPAIDFILLFFLVLQNTSAEATLRGHINYITQFFTVLDLPPPLNFLRNYVSQLKFDQICFIILYFYI